MKTTYTAIATLALSCLAGTALAQEALIVSGLTHTAVGGATLGPVDGRRLPVHNLGSSGQDGVEIQLNSVAGGGAGMGLGGVMATAGSEIKIRHKGWDGLIYGTHRIANGGGSITQEFDLSGLNPASVRVQQFDISGTVISDVNLPGPIVAVPWVPNWYCNDGSIPVYWEGWVVLCTNGCNPVWTCGWACPNSGGVYTFNEMMRVTPNSGPGTPPFPPPASMQITAGGLTDLTVEDASLHTFGLTAWGVGAAQIAETCTDPVCTQRGIRVNNIGSSGEDGVAIDLGNDVGGVSLQMSKGCCRGHVTLMKLTDDEGQEQRVSQNILDMDPAGATMVELDANFGPASPGFVLTLYTADGGVVGPAGGTGIINGGPKPVYTNRCLNGASEIWENHGTQGNPVWVFMGCDDNINRMVLPNGTAYEGVAYYSIAPMGAAHQGRLRHVVITKNGSELELRGVTTVPPQARCGTADFNGDGDIGTDADIESFFACLAGTCCATCGSADFNADGDIGTDSDIESFFRVLSGGPC